MPTIMPPAQAACSSYDSSSDTIYVTCDTTLPSVRTTINDGNQLKYLGSGQYLLRANIRVTDGDTLAVSNADGVTWLKIVGDRGIRVDGGADFVDVKVTSWSTSSNAVVNNGGDGPRAWIQYYDSERAVIRDSEFGYLGFTGGSSWKRGLSFEENSNYVRIDNSEFHHFYYAFYSNGLSNAIISDSEYRNNHQYAIDPHTGTHNMDIVRNYVHDNAGAGIICSLDCYDILVEENRVEDNSKYGIFLSRDMHDSVVRNNIVTGSPVGVVVSESSNNNIYGNSISSTENGIYITQPEVIDDGYSRGNSIHDNTISDATYAISVYRADSNTFADNDIESVDTYEYYLVDGATIRVEDQHFSNDKIYGTSGSNKVTIADSGRITVNGGTTYNTDSAPYSKTLTNQRITVDSP
jgi:parallel beta-helix repeat protein